jgi:hypothetical protein
VLYQYIISFDASAVNDINCVFENFPCLLSSNPYLPNTIRYDPHSLRLWCRELAYQAAHVAASTRATAAPPASVAARGPPTGLWTPLAAFFIAQGLSLPTKVSLLLILSEAVLLGKSVFVHLRVCLAPASEVFV